MTESDAVEGNGRSSSAVTGAVSGALGRLRVERRAHATALAIAVGVGLLLSWLHWLGLLVAGMLLGLVAPTLRRAVVSALGFGLLVLVAVLLTLGSTAWLAFEATPVSYVLVASAFGLPVLGSLVRGIV